MIRAFRGAKLILIERKSHPSRALIRALFDLQLPLDLIIACSIEEAAIPVGLESLFDAITVSFSMDRQSAVVTDKDCSYIAELTTDNRIDAGIQCVTVESALDYNRFWVQESQAVEYAVRGRARSESKKAKRQEAATADSASKSKKKGKKAKSRSKSREPVEPLKATSLAKQFGPAAEPGTNQHGHYDYALFMASKFGQSDIDAYGDSEYINKRLASSSQFQKILKFIEGAKESVRDSQTLNAIDALDALVNSPYKTRAMGDVFSFLTKSVIDRTLVPDQIAEYAARLIYAHADFLKLRVKRVSSSKFDPQASWADQLDASEPSTKPKRAAPSPMAPPQAKAVNFDTVSDD